MDKQQIGEAIKRRRKYLKINQQDFADLAGVGINTLVAIERGKGNPTMDNFLKIIDTLGLQADLRIKQMS